MAEDNVVRDELDDYFMKPYYLEEIGNIYPIEIFNYNEFKILASKYIIPNNKYLYDLFRMPKEMNLLDYYVLSSLEIEEKINEIKNIRNIDINSLEKDVDKEKYYQTINILNDYQNNNSNYFYINELCRLFSLVTNSKVRFVNTQDNYYFYIENNNKFIDNKNFLKLREIIMWQNILFTMPTSSSKGGNKGIQNAIKDAFGENESSLSSICSVVKCNSNVTDEDLLNYTYYRLMYDFSIINRQQGNTFSFMLRSQGCSEALVENLSEPIDLHKNPYDCIFRKHKYSTKI